MRPVRFTRYVVISGRSRGRHICRPYEPSRNVGITAILRAWLAPPLLRDDFLSCRGLFGKLKQE